MGKKIAIPKNVSENVRAVYKTDSDYYLAEVWLKKREFGTIIAISPRTFKNLVQGRPVSTNPRDLMDEIETERFFKEHGLKPKL